jgi:hypothetical protein
VDLAMIGAGFWLVFTVAACSAYLAAGLTASLWDHGNGCYLTE